MQPQIRDVRATFWNSAPIVGRVNIDENGEVAVLECYPDLAEYRGYVSAKAIDDAQAEIPYEVVSPASCQEVLPCWRRYSKTMRFETGEDLATFCALERHANRGQSVTFRQAGPGGLDLQVVWDVDSSD